jgi:hypothetical protein
MATARTRIRPDFLSDHGNYKEFSYNGDGTLASVIVYADSTMATTLRTKSFTYTSGDLTSVTITYAEIPGSPLTKTFVYNGDGTLASVDNT